MRRRLFLQSGLTATALGLPRASLAALRRPVDDARSRGRDLAGMMGITTGSFTRHLGPAARSRFALLDLPKIMRDELDLQVIDLMTATFPYRDAAYCERFRKAADDAGRIVTNLKLNLDVDPTSDDAEVRRTAIGAYRQGIDAAQRLGCRWVRPAAGPKRPNVERLAAAYRELIEYAEPRGISLLVENNGWMRSDPSALPRLVEAVGPGVAVQPDTGNWTPEARYAGLERAYPSAVSCDFKALKLGPDGSHADYDLRKCFDIGRRAGFRGPWCFEHFHDDLAQLLREFVLLRDLLRTWTAEYDQSAAGKPGG